MEADIRVTAEGDVKPLIDALNAAGGATDKFAKKAATNLQQAATKIKSSSNSAAFALQNLGRVAQDAPFGFIGIQNNINPLIESFQRLKAETGSTKGALKSLVGSLAGAGGIGLAVSVLTGLLTVLAQKGFFTAGKASTAAADEIKKFNKTIQETKSSAIATGLSLQEFVNIARDQTQSLETRNEALKQANKILGDHGEKLTLVNIATAGVTEQINKFTEATIQQSLAAKFSDRAADLIIKQADALKALNTARSQEEATVKRLTGTVGDFGGAANRELARVTGKTEDARQAFFLLTNEVKSVKAQLSAAQLSASQLFGELGGGKKDTILTDPEKSKKIAKAVETIDDVLKKMRHDLEVLNKEGFLLGFDAGPKQIEVIKTALKTLLDKFNLGTTDRPVVQLGVEISELELKERLKGTVAAIQTGNLAAPIKIPVTVEAPKPVELKKQLLPISEAVLALQAQVKQTLEELSAGIGDALGKALSGQGNVISNLVTSVFQVMGDFLINLGKAAIASSKLIQAIAASAANPISGILAGIAAIAVGTVLKNIQTPKFATGGFVNGPGSATSDSIHARLSKGEYVINAATVSKFGKGFFDNINGGNRPRNNQFAGGGFVSGSIGGGISQTIIPDVVLRGTDLVLVFNRAQKRLGRNG